MVMTVVMEKMVIVKLLAVDSGSCDDNSGGSGSDVA